MKSYNSGQSNGRAVLSAAAVEDIRRLFLQGQHRITDVSRIFKISVSSAFRILNCESWRSVWPCESLEEETEYLSKMARVRDGKKSAKIKHDSAVEIVMRAHGGESQASLALEFGITKQNMNNIVHGAHHNLAYREAMMRMRRGEKWQ